LFSVPQTGDYGGKVRCAKLKFDLYGTLPVVDCGTCWYLKRPFADSAPETLGYQQGESCREYRSASMTLINRVFAALVVLMGLGLLLGGICVA
jgi:hypothetical protein